jgi:RNA polymerase sigma-70 factor, ECF subfamily
MESDRQQITEMLNGLRAGDEAARAQIIALVYPELRKIASQYMRKERREHTLQPTALVHEAYLRLAGQREQPWKSRTHFFAVASQVMRQVLVDHARKHHTAKRGGGAIRVDFDSTLALDDGNATAILDVDKALDRLAQWDARQAEVVVLRFFGGLTEEEIAQTLNVSERTVKRDWRMARAWLKGILAGQDSCHDA